MNLTSKIPNTKLIIFDLDGTLYNKRRLSFHMVIHALCDIRKMQAERKTRASMKGVWLGDRDTFYHTYFQQLAQQIGSSVEIVQQWYENRYMPLMVKMIKQHHPMGEWVLPFIDDCKEKGIKMVVLSDYEHAADKLQALGISPTLFDMVVSAPELGGLKPAPELLFKISELMNIDPNYCLVIGDREDTDGALAQSTNAQFYKIQY